MRRVLTATLVVLMAASGAALAYLTDSNVHAPPQSGTYDYDAFTPASGSFPAVGASYVDPVFGGTVKRLSDTYPNIATGNNQDLYAHAYASINKKHFFHMDTSGVQHIKLVSDGSTVCSNVPKGPEGHRQWSSTDEDVMFYVSGSTLSSYSAATCSSTALKTFGGTLDKLGGSLNFADRTDDVFVVGWAAGGVKVWERSTNSTYTGASPALPGDGHVSIAPDASYIYYVNGGTFEAYPLDHDTNTVGSAIDFWTDGGDHAAFLSGSDGNQYMIRLDSLIDGGFYVADVRDRSGQTASQQRTLSSNGVTKIFDNNGGWDLDFHATAAWVGTYSDWFFINTEDDRDDFDAYQSGGAWVAHQNEIIAINAVTKEKRRLAHHRSRSPVTPYDYQPRVSSSPDASVIIWTSNFNINNVSGGAAYVDIYGIEDPVGVAADPTSLRCCKTASGVVVPLAAANPKMNRRQIMGLLLAGVL